MLCTFLRLDHPRDPGTPQAYRDNHARDAAAVVARITEEGGTAVAVDADLSDPATPTLLFDTAEQQLGPVDILVNNATGRVADTKRTPLDIFHVLLHVDSEVLAERIKADKVEPKACQWRLDHISDYEKARPWMESAADLVIDVTNLPVVDVAERIAVEAERRIAEGLSHQS